MELETQVQVSTNQLRRQDEENKKLREQLEQAVNREKEMANKAREQQHRYLCYCCFCFFPQYLQKKKLPP